MAELSSAAEIERKYDVEDAAASPLLTTYAVDDAGVEHLRAVYLDTRRGDLARRRTTLRRREGGHDEGWHLKLPAAEGRTEVTAPLSDALPVELAARLVAVLRGRRVWPIARIETTRARRILRDESGRGVAELVDDLVRATQVRGRVVRTWREWEVELLPGAAETEEGRTAILDAVEADLVRSGAAPSRSTSKLARSLGRTRLGREVRSSPTAAVGALLPALAELVESVVERDPDVRRDAPEAVHRMRVDVRRIRSVLASSRDVLDPGVTEPLRRRLHRLQTELEPARDSEVRAASAEAMLERGVDDPDRLLERYVVARAREEHTAAMVQLDAYLSTRGYLRLLDDLDLLVARPPLGRRALGKGVPTLRRDLVRQARRASRRLADADTSSLDSLHEGRKAVRRVRYLAEALTRGDDPVLGEVVVELGAAAKALQDELGDARDAELHAERLERLAVEAADDGHDAAPLREAARLERASAEELLARVPEARRAYEEARAALESASDSELHP